MKSYSTKPRHLHGLADIAALLPFTLFYEQDNYPALPGFIYAWADALERRDEALFKTIAGAAGDGGFGDGSAGMQMAVLCNDGDVQAQGLASQGKTATPMTSPVCTQQDAVATASSIPV